MPFVRLLFAFVSTHLLYFLTGFSRQTPFYIAFGSTSFSSSVLMNLDSIKGSEKSELEKTPHPREFLAKQDDIRTQNCRASKGVLSFQRCLQPKCSRTWERSSMGLSPLCGRICTLQGDKSGSYNSGKGLLQEPCPTWLFAQERTRKSRAVPRMPLPFGGWQLL